MKHEVKIWPQFYSRVADGSKTFDTCNAEDGFQSGDIIMYREWDPAPVSVTDRSIPKGFTDSPAIEFTIGYMQVTQTQIIFSLHPLKKSNAKIRA